MDIGYIPELRTAGSLVPRGRLSLDNGKMAGLIIVS